MIGRGCRAVRLRRVDLDIRRAEVATLQIDNATHSGGQIRPRCVWARAVDGRERAPSAIAQLRHAATPRESFAARGAVGKTHIVRDNLAVRAAPNVVSVYHLRRAVPRTGACDRIDPGLRGCFAGDPPRCTLAAVAAGGGD